MEPAEGSDPSWWLTGFRIDAEAAGVSRYEVIARHRWDARELPPRLMRFSGGVASFPQASIPGAALVLPSAGMAGDRPEDRVTQFPWNLSCRFQLASMTASAVTHTINSPMTT